LFLAILGLPVFLASSQTQRPTSKKLSVLAFKLISATATGSKRYTPEEIIAASGLRLGQTVSEADFKVASQHLGDTGVFSEVGYSFQYSSEGAKLELQVTDSGLFVPARFDNFVWLSDEALLQQLRERVPLFQGQLPVSGSLADQVSDALQALLIEHKVNGRVDYLRAGPEDGPIEAIDFSVSGPNIRVGNVEFTGVGAGELPLLQAAAKPMLGAEYRRSILRAQEDKNLLPVYLARGYLKAAFAAAEAKVARESPQETIVDLSFAVSPGSRYKLTDVQWSGNSVFPTEQLQGLIHLRAGEAANAVELATDLDAVRRLYGTRGYLATSIESTPQMDDAQSTVSYRLEVHEGDIYKMGDLEIQGLDERNAARLEDDWQLRSGDPYDSSYPKRFVDEALKKLSLIGEWNASVHETPDDKSETVDVTVRFDPKPPR
jgi:outer membrane protein assembly factor BamA